MFNVVICIILRNIFALQDCFIQIIYTDNNGINVVNDHPKDTKYTETCVN